MESLLKADIVKESKSFNGNFLIHDEVTPNEVRPVWESGQQTSFSLFLLFHSVRSLFAVSSLVFYTHEAPVIHLLQVVLFLFFCFLLSLVSFSYHFVVTDPAIQTSREVFDFLAGEGFPVEYHRLPVTPEKEFDRKDIDQVSKERKIMEGKISFRFACLSVSGKARMKR